MVRILFLILCMHALTLVNGQTESFDFDRKGLDSLKTYYSLEEALSSDETVYRLDLSRTRLRTFPTEIFELTELKELDVSKNKIAELPEAMELLRNLEVLNIGSNKLTMLPDSLFALKNLRLLDASNNNLDAIPDDYGELASLSHLVLWGNAFAYFTERLAELEYLVYLDLLHNEMDKREQAWLKELLPEVDIQLSEPCRCDFSEEE